MIIIFDKKIQNSSYLVFRNYLEKRIRPLAAPVYSIHNPLGLKLLTRLRLGLSHLNEHRFNHNFESCLNPLCTCSLEVESATHFFLHCHHFNAICIARNNSLKGIDDDILKLSDSSLTKVILVGDFKYSDFQNHDILNSTITFNIDSKRFDCSLLQCKAHLSIYSKINVIFVRNLRTMLSLFNLYQNHVKKIISMVFIIIIYYHVSLTFFIISQ